MRWSIDVVTAMAVFVRALVSIGWLFLTCTGVWAQNLVLNGGFESGFSNWTAIGSVGTPIPGTVQNSGENLIFSPEGTHHARFGPSTPGGIYQTFATTIGQVYSVSYYLHTGTLALGTRLFQAQVGNPSGLTTLESLTNPSLLASFTPRSFRFVATSTTSEIRFTFQSTLSFWRIDDVVVTAVVPELDSSGMRPGLLVVVLLVLTFGRSRSVLERTLPGDEAECDA